MARKAMPRDFAKLWAALSVSLMGSQITTLALPLLAALTLRASALEMGVLAAAGQLPFLLFSLPAGAWVDRLPRRPVLIATDVASALLLLSVPLAVPFGGRRSRSCASSPSGSAPWPSSPRWPSTPTCPPWWAAST